MSDIPQDLIADIFRRLPVKSLGRFRCVSKHIGALISSPHFINLHLNQSPRNIIVPDYGKFYSLNLDSLENPILKKMKEPVKSSDLFAIFGSCNGLLCVKIEDIIVWNPSTQQYKQIPDPKIEFPDGFSDCKRVSYGFGYDHLNDDYKVVRVALFDNTVENDVKVYGLKSQSWRRTKDFPYFLCNLGDDCKFVNGALHWVVTLDQSIFDRNRLIASFDLATEEYHMVPHPEFSEMILGMSVGEVEGKLTFCSHHTTSMDLWVMNTYRVKESWTKLFSVAYENIGYIENLTTITYSNDGKILLLEEYNGGLLCYDFKLKTLKDIMIADNFCCWNTYVCVESLVKFDDGSRSDVHIEEKENPNVDH